MENDPIPSQRFALLAACFEGGISVVAVGLGWLLGCHPLQTFHWTFSAAGWGTAAVLPPLGLLWLCVKCPWRPLARIMEVIDEILLPLFDRCGWLELAIISALAGLGEELLFRGVVQTSIGLWWGGRLGMWAGLSVAAVLFGLAHAVTFTYVLLAGLIGLYLGAVWLLTGNLLVPILAHGLYDFLALVYLLRIREPARNGRPAR
jgi:membrane protease YdiL (CAAX protease family)